MVTRRSIIGAAAFTAASAGSTLVSYAVVSDRKIIPAARGRLLGQLPAVVPGWQVDSSQADMIEPVVLEPAFAEAVAMYDFIAAREYVAPAGTRIMLNAVYMKKITEESRFHWPEFCYATQGFRVEKSGNIAIDARLGVVGTCFIATREDRREVVVYWTRVGRSVPVGSMQMRMAIFRDSLRAVFPDGVLLRGSTILPPDGAIEDGKSILRSFLAGLLHASSEAVRTLIAGAASATAGNNV